jgi:hypothetical protein
LSAYVSHANDTLPRVRARQGVASLMLVLLAATANAHEAAPPPAARHDARALPPLVLDRDATVAFIDGERIGSSALAVLQRYRALEGSDVAIADVLADVVEQRALARHAAAKLTRDALFPDRRVAFAPEVSVDDKLTGILRAVFRERIDTALAEQTGDSLERALIATPMPTTEQLREVLGDPAKIRLEYTLDEGAGRKAPALVIARYRGLDAREHAVTLADVYARQNVQGRMSLHQLDAEFLVTQANTRVASLLVQEWASRVIGAEAVAELRRNLLDREYARGLREHYGLGADMHDSNAYLDGLRRAVKPDEIAAWYAAHREQFRRVERVRARHIRVADEATATRVAATLAKDGTNFAELARTYSIAPDRTGGGELGWLARRSEADWFVELVFAQPVGRNGTPVREPVAANVAAQWEIVRVDEQQTGYFPVASETVRYLASRAIAERKARKVFASLQQAELRATKVRYLDAAARRKFSP